MIRNWDLYYSKESCKIMVDNQLLSIVQVKATRYLVAFGNYQSENVILPLGCFSANSKVCCLADTWV